MIVLALIASFGASLARINYRIIFFLLLIVFTAVFCVMNASKVIEDDWVWYTQHYALMQNYTFDQYLGARIGRITIKPNEPVYYAIANATYYFSGGSISALAAVITSIAYFTTGFAMFRIGESVFSDRGLPGNALLIMGCCLFAVTFTLVTQLVRQEMAMCVSLLSYSLILRRQYITGLLVTVMAVATHQSVVIILFILYAPLVIIRMTESYRFVRPVIAIAFFTIAAGVGYYVSHGSMADMGTKDDGAIAASLIGGDAVLALTLLGLTVWKGGRSEQGILIVLSYALFYLTLLPMINLPLAALRLYFYMDVIRALAIMIIFSTAFSARMPNAIRVFASAVLLIGALAYVNQRIERSPFDFGGSFKSYVFYPATV